MNSDKLNTWISIAANIGVLFGILFLIFEVRQNTQMMQADAYEARTNAMLVPQTMITESENLQMALAKIRWDSDFCNPNSDLVQSLSEQERILVKAFLATSWRRLDSQYSQYSRGTLSSVPFLNSTLPAMKNHHVWLELFDMQAPRTDLVFQEFQDHLQGLECQ